MTPEQWVQWMRERGVEEMELTYEKNQAQSPRIRRLRLTAFVAPAPAPEPTLDADPQANELAMNALRARMKAEARAEMKADEDRLRFAASEGI